MVEVGRDFPNEGFTQYHLTLQGHLRRLDWSPTPIQEESVEHLLAGKDALLVAPTGSGKTEAAALPLFSRILSEGWEPLSILYVTPLRALNRDLGSRLRRMGEELAIKVDERHGDTSQYQRNRQVRNPPHLLVTTPETFQLMFTGSRLRELLIGVKAVVIDEVHDLASSERGAQLSIGLTRLEAHIKKRVQRIGLSATIGNPKEVASWLSEGCEVIVGPSHRPVDLTIKVRPPTPADENLALELQVGAKGLSALRGVVEQVAKKPHSLLFVNTRNAAETISQRLSTLSPALRIGVHHGSLAADTREEMESAHKRGELDCLVCTSSLELGLDLGPVREVIQIGSPRSVERMLQRAGRADHVLGGTARGTIYCWELDEIAEAGVIARRSMARDLEGIEWRETPLSVVVNQLVMMSRQQYVVPLSTAYSVVKAAPQFSSLDEGVFIALLKLLEERWLVHLVTDPTELEKDEWPEEVWEHEEETHSRVLKKKYLKGWYTPGGRSRKHALSNISMIPDEQRYRVREAVTRRSIGNVDEGFILTLNSSGEEESGGLRRFVMAGRTWQVVEADPEREELLVNPVNEHGEAPIWVGEMPPVPARVAREVGRLRRLLMPIEANGTLEDSEEEPWRNLSLPVWPLSRNSIGSMPTLNEFPFTSTARGVLEEAVMEHLEVADSVPHDRLLTIEEREGTVVLNTCNGSRINEALGIFLQAMASTRGGKMGRLTVEPYRVVLQLSGISAADFVHWLTTTPPSAIPWLLSSVAPNSRQLRWRFVQVAKTFGALEKGVDPRKVNLEGMMKRYKETPLMDEVLSKLFHERVDAEGCEEVLNGIQQGELGLLITAPGPLGTSPKLERDLLLPNWSSEEVRAQLESRLINERVTLCCLKCHSTRSLRVARWDDGHQKCNPCGGGMSAVAREGLRERLVEWVSSNDEGTSQRMFKNAEMVKYRGIDAILCLVSRGVGEETTGRILRVIKPGDKENLLEAIHEAELNYARTRRFWG